MQSNFEIYYKELENVNNYLDASKIALSIIKEMPRPVGQVCGPITTGGVGSVKENLKIFSNTIEKLTQEGKNIFNQLPFEETLKRIRNNDWRPFSEKNLRLLKEFYGTVFESGLVENLYFIHGWEKSFGTTWEHRKTGILNLNRMYLPKDYIKQ